MISRVFWKWLAFNIGLRIKSLNWSQVFWPFKTCFSMYYYNFLFRCVIFYNCKLNRKEGNLTKLKLRWHGDHCCAGLSHYLDLLFVSVPPNNETFSKLDFWRRFVSFLQMLFWNFFVKRSKIIPILNYANVCFDLRKCAGHNLPKKIRFSSTSLFTLKCFQKLEELKVGNLWSKHSFFPCHSRTI